MSDSLEKLVKEIDALTYNARSVMNALNRSVLSSSSSNGFTITRASEKLVLTRPLIYRLSKFYEEWANNEFFTGPPDDAPDSSGRRSFTLILSDHDLIPLQDQDINNVITLTPSPTTEALVVHSKILFLTPDNISNTNDNSYWLELLKTATNPKLITNSAPIPLNIRTPIFDENLSTTRFLSHESYLFPYAYFALDTLGYSGDANNHQLAGLSWEIVADDFIRLLAHKISMGGMTPGAIFKTWANRVGDYALAWGYDTNARGSFSTAGGLNTFAASEGSIAIGNKSIASGLNAIVLGDQNSAPGNDSASIGGNNNYAIADNSGVFVGENNITGEQWYNWTFDVQTSNVCTLDSEGNPVIETQVSAIDKNKIKVSGATAGNFNPGDTIRIFDFTTVISLSDDHNLFTELNGNGFNHIDVIVDTVDSNTNIITITSSINYPNVDGGKLSRIINVTDNIRSGRNSFATGTNNIASGETQTVVGKYNKQIVDARFIVGSGQDVVGSGPKNSFVVGDNYISAFAVGDAYYISNEDVLISDSTYAIHVDNEKAIVKSGNSLINMINNRILIESADSLSAPTSLTFLTLNTTDIQLYAQSGSLDIQSSDLTLKSFNNTGIDVGGQLVISSLISSSLTTPIFVSYVSELIVNASVSISLTWSITRVTPIVGAESVGQFYLNGQTYGALPTDADQYAHVCGDGTTYPQAAINTTVSNIGRSGFYQFYDATANIPDDRTLAPNFFPPFVDIGGDSNKAWLLNISGKDLDPLANEVYNAWQIAFGLQTGNFDQLQTTGHIAVRRARNGISIPEANGIRSTWRYLAWQDDLASYELSNDFNISNLQLADATLNAKIDESRTWISHNPLVIDSPVDATIADWDGRYIKAGKYVTYVFSAVISFGSVAPFLRFAIPAGLTVRTNPIFTTIASVGSIKIYSSSGIDTNPQFAVYNGNGGPSANKFYIDRIGASLATAGPWPMNVTIVGSITFEVL